MFRRYYIAGLALSAALASSAAYGQAIPAVRQGDIEAGFTFSTASPDLNGVLTNTTIPAPKDRIWGGSIYVNYNLGGHVGVVAQFDYPDAHTPDDTLEKSYMAGLRYMHPINRYVPYVKALAGIGSLSYDKPANWITYPGVPGSYGAFAFGAGLDIRLTHKFIVRAVDVQYEDWPGVPSGGIHPVIISIGASYRVR